MFLSVGKYKKLIIVADAGGFNGRSLLVLFASRKICDQGQNQTAGIKFSPIHLADFEFDLIETIKLHLSTR